MNHSIPILVGLAFAGYLLGSVPFGLILTFLAGKGDIRSIGSGNIGATNVLRTGSKPLAIATLLLDASKGALTVLIIFLLSDHLPALRDPVPVLVAAFFTVVGHNFPVWLRFRGGKGVATTLGAFLAVAWPVGLAACLIWLATALVFRFSSLAALAALSCSPFLAVLLTGSPEIAVFCFALSALGFVRHGTNIRRLLAGREPKIGQK